MKFEKINNGVSPDKLKIGADKINVVIDELTTTNIINSNREDSKVRVLDFIEHKNRSYIDKLNLTSGGYHSWETGVWTTDASYSSTGFIPIKTGVTFQYNGVINMTFWNKDESFVSGNLAYTQATKEITVTNVNIAFVKLAIKNTDIDLSYFRQKLTDNEFLLQSQIKVSQQNIEETSSTIIRSQNLFNKNTAIAGGYYEWTNGTWKIHSGYYSSDLIPVDFGKWYRFDGAVNVSFWDKDSSYISGNLTTTEVQIINENIKYLRLAIPKLKVDTMMVTERHLYPSTYVPYEETKYVFSDKWLIDENNISKEAMKNLFNEISNSEIESTEKLGLLKPYSKVTNPILTKNIVTDRNASRGVADPFIVKNNGRYHCFFEVLSDVADEIGHAYSDNLIDWTYTQIVLSKEVHGHRSAYPYVFNVDGIWYMVPDSSADYVKLYKATDFPNKWEFVTNLLDTTLETTKAVVDTNIFKFKGLWYMTTTGGKTGWDTGVALYVNKSGDFKNNLWELHPEGLIIQTTDVDRGLRGAGNPIVYEDYVLLPIQATPKATGVYGQYTYLYKLSDLSDTTVNAVNLGKLTSNSGGVSWNSKSSHHVSSTDFFGGKIFAVDGQTENGVYSVGLYTKQIN